MGVAEVIASNIFHCASYTQFDAGGPLPRRFLLSLLVVPTIRTGTASSYLLIRLELSWCVSRWPRES